MPQAPSRTKMPSPLAFLRRRKAAHGPVRGKKRVLRVLLIGAAAAIGAVAALWVAIHRFEWMGPLVANTLRAVIGVDNVAKLEDAVYAVEDRVNRWFKRNEKPRAYWKVPASASVPPPPPPPPSAGAAPELPPFQPKDPGPALKAWSADGDGVWVPIRDPRRPGEAPYLFKTLLHPDAGRSWAEVFVVAVDTRRVDVHFMVGSQEPKAADPKQHADFPRPARIPDAHHDELLAAFNGGFMTEHGGYGAKLDGVVLVPPKPAACTFALHADGSLRIATWKALSADEASMTWYRQAPACMVEGDKLHPGLLAGSGLKWGATLDGDTVIRRSAVGLNAARDVLYVAITNHTTARVLADGMRHVGAVDVAQMDVNWSYPKFVLFEPGDAGPERKAVALAEGFEFSEDEFIRKRARRDFFYLMRKPPAQR